MHKWEYRMRISCLKIIFLSASLLFLPLISGCFTYYSWRDVGRYEPIPGCFLGAYRSGGKLLVRADGNIILSGGHYPDMFFQFKKAPGIITRLENVGDSQGYYFFSEIRLDELEVKKVSYPRNYWSENEELSEARRISAFLSAADVYELPCEMLEFNRSKYKGVAEVPVEFVVGDLYRHSFKAPINIVNWTYPEALQLQKNFRHDGMGAFDGAKSHPCVVFVSEDSSIEVAKLEWRLDAKRRERSLTARIIITPFTLCLDIIALPAYLFKGTIYLIAFLVG